MDFALKNNFNGFNRCVCVLGEGALSEEEGRVENNTHVLGFMLWW